MKILIPPAIFMAISMTLWVKNDATVLSRYKRAEVEYYDIEDNKIDVGETRVVVEETTMPDVEDYDIEDNNIDNGETRVVVKETTTIMPKQRIIFKNMENLMLRIDEFVKDVTSGNKTDFDATAMLKPLMRMDESLGNAPLVITVLQKIYLQAMSNPDFSLDDVGMEWNYTDPSVRDSFRASVTKLCQTSYWALYNAHMGMFRIQNLMSRVKPNLDDAMEVLYTLPTEAMELLFPMHLEEMKNVANEARSIAEEIVNQFHSAFFAQNELSLVLTKKHSSVENRTIENQRIRFALATELTFADKMLTEIDKQKERMERIMEKDNKKYLEAMENLKDITLKNFDPPAPSDFNIAVGNEPITLNAASGGQGGSGGNGYGAEGKGGSWGFLGGGGDGGAGGAGTGGAGAVGGRASDFGDISGDISLGDIVVTNKQPALPKYEFKMTLPPIQSMMDGGDPIDDVPEESKVEEEKKQMQDILTVLQNEVERVGNFFHRYNQDVVNEIKDAYKISTTHLPPLNDRSRRRRNVEVPEPKLELQPHLNSVTEKITQLENVETSEKANDELKNVMLNTAAQFQDLLKIVNTDKNPKKNTEKFERMFKSIKSLMEDLNLENFRAVNDAYVESTEKIDDILMDFNNRLKTGVYDEKLKTGLKNASEVQKLIDDWESKKMDTLMCMCGGGNREMGEEVTKILNIAVNIARHQVIPQEDYLDSWVNLKQNVNSVMGFLRDEIMVKVGDTGTILSKPSWEEESQNLRPIPNTIELVVEGHGAAQVGAAQVLLLKAEHSLKQSRFDAHKAQQKKMRALEKQHKNLIEMYNLNFTGRTVEKTIEAATEGLKALAAQETEWGKLMRAFGEMSIVVDTQLSNALNLYVNKTSKIRGLPPKVFAKTLKKGKDYIFKTAYKSNTISYVVEHQSAIYTQISKEVLLPLYDTFKDLIGLNDEDEIQNATMSLNEDASNAMEQIQWYITEHAKEFDDGIIQRLKNLHSSYEKMVPKLSERDQEAQNAANIQAFKAFQAFTRAQNELTTLAPTPSTTTLSSVDYFNNV